MAVLQRSGIEKAGITNISTHYPFRLFEEQLIEFDGLLKNGGLLILSNSNYTFESSSLKDKYTVLKTQLKPDAVPKFNKEGEPIQVAESNFIFIKKSSPK